MLQLNNFDLYVFCINNIIKGIIIANMVMIIGLFDEPYDFSMSITVEFYCILFYGVADEFLSINPLIPNLLYFIMVY